MFWSLILPFQITLVVTALGAVAASFYARHKRWRPVRSFILILLLGAVAFVPSCLVVDTALAPFRFRNFWYATSDAIRDERVLRYFPTNATDISVKKRRNGFLAEYTIAREDLDAWYDALLIRVNPTVEHPGKPPVPDSRNGHADGWIKYEGPRQGNWAGFTISYHPGTKCAVHQSADW